MEMDVKELRRQLKENGRARIYTANAPAIPYTTGSTYISYVRKPEGAIYVHSREEFKTLCKEVIDYASFEKFSILSVKEIREFVDEVKGMDKDSLIVYLNSLMARNAIKYYIPVWYVLAFGYTAQGMYYLRGGEMFNRIPMMALAMYYYHGRVESNTVSYRFQSFSMMNDIEDTRTLMHVIEYERSLGDSAHLPTILCKTLTKYPDGRLLASDVKTDSDAVKKGILTLDPMYSPLQTKPQYFLTLGKYVKKSGKATNEASRSCDRYTAACTVEEIIKKRAKKISDAELVEKVYAATKCNEQAGKVIDDLIENYEWSKVYPYVRYIFVMSLGGAFSYVKNRDLLSAMKIVYSFPTFYKNNIEESMSHYLMLGFSGKNRLLTVMHERKEYALNNFIQNNNRGLENVIHANFKYMSNKYNWK
jgi:hypothetical protein